MSWNYERSLERIHTHLDTMGQIEVTKLIRLTDLEGLLTETTCRDIYGAHVYVQVSNFAHLASNGLYAQDSYKRLIQGIHIYQRQVTRIVESFNGVFVHFQGPKLHALFYRPIDNGKQLAIRAVLLQLVLKDFVHNVFNQAFPDYDDFTIAGGTDLGNAIGTSNGINGDRELLFLGAPANHAAKIIGSAGQLRLTQHIYDALPNDLRNLCVHVVENLYQLKSVASPDLDELLRAHSFTWKRDVSAKQIEDDKKRFLLKDISYSSAETLIDLDGLSIKNNKRVLAASLFADLSGFTRYIDAAKSEQEQRTALRVLHTIRKEMARVIKGDFTGLRVQYQGDRVQGLFHLPQDDEVKIAMKAVETAVGLQSSMEHTLKACLPEAKDLRLAIGIDMGTVLISKLGAYGKRDRICLGDSVECAAQLEERSKGSQIGISKRVYEALPTTLRGYFTYSSAVQGYAVTDLTAEKVERATRATQGYRAGGPVFLRTTSTGVMISHQEEPNARSIVPARPYAAKV